MDKDAILKTAVLRYEEDYYVVESPITYRVVGAAETPEEAWQIFHEILAETYEKWKAGKLAGYEAEQAERKGPGRPRKGKSQFNVDISPETKHEITKTAKSVGISQGEVVEWAIMKLMADESMKQAKAS